MSVAVVNSVEEVSPQVVPAANENIYQPRRFSWRDGRARVRQAQLLRLQDRLAAEALQIELTARLERR